MILNVVFLHCTVVEANISEVEIWTNETKTIFMAGYLSI